MIFATGEPLPVINFLLKLIPDYIFKSSRGMSVTSVMSVMSECQ